MSLKAKLKKGQVIKCSDSATQRYTITFEDFVFVLIMELWDKVLHATEFNLTSFKLALRNIFYVLFSHAILMVFTSEQRTREGFAPENIVIAAGIIKLKLVFVLYYLAVLKQLFTEVELVNGVHLRLGSADKTNY